MLITVQGANNAAGTRIKRFPTRGSPRAWGSSFVAPHPSHFKAASENVWPGQASGWQSADATLFAGVPRLTRDMSQKLITCRRGRCSVGLSVRHGVRREGVRCRWLRGRTRTRAGVDELIDVTCTVYKPHKRRHQTCVLCRQSARAQFPHPRFPMRQNPRLLAPRVLLYPQGQHQLARWTVATRRLHYLRVPGCINLEQYWVQHLTAASAAQLSVRGLAAQRRGCIVRGHYLER